MKKKILFALLIILNINIVFAKEINKNAVQYITDLYNNADKTVVTVGAYYDLDLDQTTKTIDYNYAKSVNLMNDRLGSNEISLDGGNIRYYGASPNNYIDIGDKYETDYTYIVANKMQEKIGYINTMDTLQECYDYDGIDNEYCRYETLPAGTPILWRIIGVFDGKVRIVRDESIGYYAWDSSSYTEGKKVNDGFGINEWSQADIMKLLNPGYDNNSDEICTYDYKNPYSCSQNNDLINNSLWWNSQSGICYTDYKNISKSCDFTSIGLSDNAKKYISNQTIYLGSLEDQILFPSQAYMMERETTTYNQQMGCRHNQGRCTDNIVRTTSWIGKVGLIYPSDYGYASDLNDCNATLDNYSIEKGTCHLTNWIFNGRYHHNFTTTPYRTNAFGIYMVHDNTVNPEKEFIDFYFHDEYNAGTIRPTLMLDSTLIFKSGEGTKEDPYVIGKEDKYTATINYYGEDGKLLDIENNPYILDNLSNGYTTTIKSPKVSGCYAKDVKVSITDKDEVYDVKYSCSVMVNPKTGRLFIILGIILSIVSINYLLYYIKNKKEVFD